MSDFSNFLDVQTKTAWGRTLGEFASFCAPKSDALILDVGCGPGLLPTIFARQGCEAFGVDHDFDLLISALVSSLAQADALKLPFPPESFDLITATNVLFLLDDPLAALSEWMRVLAPLGEICLLNPSEHLNISAATQLANARGLNGTARKSLLHWAQNAESHFHWTEKETRKLLAQTGLQFQESTLKVGPGFARFVRASLY